MLIGELLVSLGLITQEQLDESLELQAMSGGRLGQVIAEQGYCSQDRVDHVWAEAEILPALREAVGRALGGDSESATEIEFRLASLSRRTMIQEDLLNGCSKTEVPMGIEGLAELSFDRRAWVPFQFVFLAKSRIAYLDAESAITIKNWAAAARQAAETQAAAVSSRRLAAAAAA